MADESLIDNLETKKEWLTKEFATFRDTMDQFEKSIAAATLLLDTAAKVAIKLKLVAVEAAEMLLDTADKAAEELIVTADETASKLSS